MAAGTIVDAAKAETGGTVIAPKIRTQYDQVAQTVLGMNGDSIFKIASFLNDAMNVQNTAIERTDLTRALSTIARMDGTALRQVLDAFVTEDGLDLPTAQTLFRLMKLREAMVGKVSGADGMTGDAFVLATSNALRSINMDTGNPGLDDALTIAASTTHNLDIARERWGMAGVNYIGNLIQSGHAKEAVLIASLPSHAKAVIVAEENMRTVALNQDAILAQANAAAQDMQNPHLLKNAAKRAEQQALLAIKAELMDEGALGDRSGLEQDVKTAERILDQSKAGLNRAVQTEQAKWNTLAKAQARFVANLADTNAMKAVHTAFGGFWNASTARKKAQQAVAGNQQALIDARQKMSDAQKRAVENVEIQAGQKLKELLLKRTEERTKLKEQAVGQDDDLRDGDGLPPLQSVDFSSDRVTLLANRNGSGIIKDGRQQLESDTVAVPQGKGNRPFRALAASGAVTDVEYANGNQDVQAPDEGDTVKEPGINDLLDAVMTPEQRFQRAKITSLIIGWLSKEQKRRIENGEDFDAIINELDSWQIDRIEHSIDKSGTLDSQQHRDFMLLSGGVFRDVALPERLAILQVLKEKAGEITADDLISLAADVLGEEVEGGYFEHLNHTPLNRTLLNEFASLLVLAYHGIENGITLEAMNAEYMAQKQGEGSSYATAMFATAVGAAVARKMFLTPGKIPGGQQGAMGNSEGSQSPVKPPESAGNHGGLAEEDSGKIKVGNLDELPDTAKNSYSSYDGKGWDGNYSGQTPGTAAGSAYRNSNGMLPKTDSLGDKITYREFDVNNHIAGAGRDAERFIVGSDGSIYYTNDHYTTFIKIK